MRNNLYQIYINMQLGVSVIVLLQCVPTYVCYLEMRIKIVQNKKFSVFNYKVCIPKSIGR